MNEPQCFICAGGKTGEQVCKEHLEDIYGFFTSNEIEHLSLKEMLTYQSVRSWLGWQIIAKRNADKKVKPKE